MSEQFIVYDDGTIVVLNPGQRYRLTQLKYMLRIEISTGMTHSRGSVLKQLQKEFGVKSRTKKAALVEVEALLDSLGSGVGAPPKSEA